MAFIEAPDFPIRSIDWQPVTSVQSNAAAYTGTRSVATQPWYTKFRAHVDLASQQGESGFRALRSFFLKCRGQTNTFRLYATTEAQNSNSGVALSASAIAGATFLTITGYTTSLAEGQYVTLNGQLLCLVGDQSGGVIHVEPPIRQAAASGTAVVTSRPYALVYLASDIKWSIQTWRLFSGSFDVEEAVLEQDGSAPEATPAVSLPIGAITLPAVFNNTLSASLTSTGSRVNYGITPYDLIDFTQTEACNQYYVSYAAGSDANAGTSASAPWKTFAYALATAASPGVINLLDDEVGVSSFDPTATALDGKFKIKGRSTRTIFHCRREADSVATFAWSSAGSGAYASTAGRCASIYRAHFDGNYRDSNGIPTPLTLAASQAACISTPGTFHWNGTTTLTVHMIDGRIPDPDNGWLYHEARNFYELRQTKTTSAGVLLWENCEVFANIGNATGYGNLRYRPVTTGSANTARVGFKNCLFYGSSDNGLQVYDGDVCVVENCVSAYNRADGFNYHSFVSTGTKGEFITVYEHNCISYQNGYTGFADQPTLTTSENGSTSHDSLHIIRTNCYHHHANGAVVADVNGVVSVNLNPIAQYPTGTASPKACFWASGTGAGSHFGMYIWGGQAYDHGDATVILVDNSGAPNGESDSQIYLQSWRGDTGGTVVGTLKDWSGNVLANLAAAA